MSTWVHRIATNVCLDMLRSARRRVLVVQSGLPEGEMGAPLGPDHWVEPMPDAQLVTATDPAAAVVQRETVRRAFVAALQRVRVTLAANRPVLGDVLDPDDAEQARLVDDYVEAFQSHDVTRLCALLRTDEVASMPPLPWRLSGAERIASLMALSETCAADRLVWVALNGSPGSAPYRPDSQGVLRPFALVHLHLEGGRVARLVTVVGSGAAVQRTRIAAVVRPLGCLCAQVRRRLVRVMVIWPLPASVWW